MKAKICSVGRLGVKLGLAAGLFAATFVHAAIVTLPASALSNSPGVYSPNGYYTNTLGPNIVTTGGGNAANVGAANGRNDDGFMALNLGFNFSFFGTTYSSLFINNNGNVSFGNGISAFVPTGPTGASQPIISPFFGDVDTRAASSGVVHYNLSASQLVVTWDQVGRFNSRSDLLNSFQLVLRGPDYVTPTGEGAIGFFYQTMGWDVTDTSVTAAVGFGNGSGDGEVIAGSNLAGMRGVVNNKYIWFGADRAPLPPVPTPTPVPEPATLPLVGLALLCAASVNRFVRRAGKRSEAV
jgi:hypothetical protein